MLIHLPSSLVASRNIPSRAASWLARLSAGEGGAERFGVPLRPSGEGGKGRPSSARADAIVATPTRVAGGRHCEFAQKIAEHRQMRTPTT